MPLVTLKKWDFSAVHVVPADVRATRSSTPVNGHPATVLVFDTETDERVRVLGRLEDVRKALGLSA